MENVNKFLNEKGLIATQKDEFVIRFEDGREFNLGELLVEFSDNRENQSDAITKASNTLRFLNQLLHGLVNGANDEILKDSLLNFQVNAFDLKLSMEKLIPKGVAPKLQKPDGPPSNLPPVTVKI